MKKLHLFADWKEGINNFFGRRSAQSYLKGNQFAMAVSGSGGSACGAGGNKPAPKPSACGAGDDKPASKPSSCGSACGAGGDKPASKPSACGSACGAGKK
jgi:ACGX-repeat protein